MKKLFMMAIALFMAANVAVIADDAEMTPEQVAAEMSNSAKRMKKINELAEKLQKSKDTGVPALDEMKASALTAALTTAANAEKMENMYKRTVSEPDADGVTEVNVTKPTVNDWLELGAGVTAQLTTIAGLAASSANLVGAVTQVISNPLKAKGALTQAKQVGEIVKLMGEETGAEAKAIKTMVQICKSNNNL